MGNLSGESCVIKRAFVGVILAARRLGVIFC